MDDKKVYIIQHELGPVKIGIAEEPRSRLRTLQVACPFTLKLKQTANPKDARAVESYLHDRFQKYHLNGEWFNIPADQRDFDIPTLIYESGRANTNVPVSDERDLMQEWANSLERFFRAIRPTMPATETVHELRDEWEPYQTAFEEPINEPDTRPGFDAAMQDTEKEMQRCQQCGHEFPLNEGSCPTCGSGDGADRYRY